MTYVDALTTLAEKQVYHRALSMELKTPLDFRNANVTSGKSIEISVFSLHIIFAIWWPTRGEALLSKFKFSDQVLTS